MTSEAIISSVQSKPSITNQIQNILFPFISIEILVLFNSISGYYRFLGLNHFYHSLNAYFEGLFSERIFLVALPIIWGGIVWILFNSLGDAVQIKDAVELCKTMAYLVFGKSVVSIQTFLFLLGCLLPYTIYELFANFNAFRISGQLVPELAVFVLWIPCLIPIIQTRVIRNKAITQVTKNDLRRKSNFYNVLASIIIPVSLILSIQVIPEGIGKLWAINLVYDAAQIQNARISYDIDAKSSCPSNYGYALPPKFLTEMEKGIVYIQTDNDKRWNSGRLPFIINTAFGRAPQFRLCIISPE